MPANDGLRRDFADALREKLEAAEFERLMLNKERPPGLIAAHDWLDVIQLDPHGGGSPALQELKAARALERLQVRHPEVWERVALTAPQEAESE